MRKFIRQHKTFILISGDVLILYFSLFATLFVRYPNHLTSQLWHKHLYPFTIIFTLWIIVFYFVGLYELDFAKKQLVFLGHLIQAFLINIALSIGFFYLVPSITPKRNLLFVVLFSFILFYLWRRVFSLIAQSKALKEKIAFVGISQEVAEIIAKCTSNPHLSYDIVFVLASKNHNQFLERIPPQIKVYQGLAKLNQLLKKTSVDKIIVAMQPETNPVLAKELYHSSSNIKFIYFPNFYEDIIKKVPLEMINRLWLQVSSDEKKTLTNFSKRVLDNFLAVIGGILLVIIFPFLFLGYILTDGLPIFFIQNRIGKGGKKFKIFKLRTMVKNARKQKTLWTEKNDTRVTPLGKFLRKFYIDELPQFVNILKGEMSVVGPRPERPELVKILEKEITFYPLRHLVKPGVTGWAQINSFYARSVEDSIEKTKYDLYYVKNYSLLFDISILLQTIKMVFSQRKKQNY